MAPPKESRFQQVDRTEVSLPGRNEMLTTRRWENPRCENWKALAELPRSFQGGAQTRTR